MPEETSTPNQPASPPAGRRRNAPEESSGGGGKVLVIILGLLVLGLGFALFKRSSGTASQTEKYTTEIIKLTNSVLELTDKLKKETNNAVVAQSNLQAVLDRRMAEMASISNRLVQTRQQLERTEADLYAARNEIAAKTTALGALEAQRDEYHRQAASIPGLERGIAAQKEKVNTGLLDYMAQKEILGRVSTEKADLERKLQDPLFLRRQATRVEQIAEARQKAAAKQPVNMYDPRVPLDIQPDGTVRPAVATTAPPKK